MTTSEAMERLYRAGWTVGDIAITGCWMVLGTNGENQIRAIGATRAGAWRLACEQAASVWMLAPPRL